MKKIVGIDISKETFDVSFLNEKQQWTHKVYENSASGFKELWKDTGKQYHFVMEASGPYYLKLATFLSKKKADISVVNPLVIRRYVQMKMFRTKTDKKDAQAIAMYGAEQNPPLWDPEEKVLKRMRQIDTTIDGYKKQKTMLKNRLKAFKASGITDKNAITSMEKMIKATEKEIRKLKKEILKLAKENYPDTLELLYSVPGIGDKNAVLFIILTANFTKFDNYKEFLAYIGFNSRIYESGTSVKGKGHISKVGNKKMRRSLYMASWSAKRYNKHIKTMYERLEKKGKNERVIKVALAGKLVKLVFGVMKTGKKYDENYEINRIANVKK